MGDEGREGDGEGMGKEWGMRDWEGERGRGCLGTRPGV